jgi:hypothetical protein
MFVQRLFLKRVFTSFFLFSFVLPFLVAFRLFHENEPTTQPNNNYFMQICLSFGFYLGWRSRLASFKTNKWIHFFGVFPFKKDFIWWCFCFSKIMANQSQINTLDFALSIVFTTNNDHWLERKLMHKSAWEGEYNLRPFFVLLSANLFSLFPPPHKMALLLDGDVRSYQKKVQLVSLP